MIRIFLAGLRCIGPLIVLTGIIMNMSRQALCPLVVVIAAAWAGAASDLYAAKSDPVFSISADRLTADPGDTVTFTIEQELNGTPLDRREFTFDGYPVDWKIGKHEWQAEPGTHLLRLYLRWIDSTGRKVYQQRYVIVQVSGAEKKGGYNHPGLSLSEVEIDTIKANVHGAAPHPMKSGLSSLKVDSRQFAHPGLFSSQEELARIRANVNGPGDHPMKAAWLRLQRSPLAKLSYQPRPCRVVTPANDHPTKLALRADGRAAYTHALEWVVTGDPRYAAKAIEIYNAWSGTFETIATRDAYKNLTAGWETPIWLAGAEIIRHYDGGAAGWSPEDVARFEGMVKALRKLCLEWDGSAGHPYRGQGATTAMVLARLSIGVFLDDPETFAAGHDLLTMKRFGDGDHSIDRLIRRIHGRPVPLVGLAIKENGEIMELNRVPRGDCGQANMGINGLIFCAEVLWHQGIDFYGLKLDGETTPRLLKGVEFFAKSCIDPPVQTTHVGKVTCRPHKPSGFEAASNHYRNRLHERYSLEETEKVMQRFGPVDATNSKALPWPTLTHAGLSAETSAVHGSQMTQQ